MRGSIWINILVGLWLVISPFAWSASTSVSVSGWAPNDIVFGILLIASSWWFLVAIVPPAGVAWFEMLCGIWLIVAPFVLRYGTRPAEWNDIVCGVIAVIAAAVAAQFTQTPTVA